MRPTEFLTAVVEEKTKCSPSPVLIVRVVGSIKPVPASDSIASFPSLPSASRTIWSWGIAQPQLQWGNWVLQPRSFEISLVASDCQLLISGRLPCRSTGKNRQPRPMAPSTTSSGSPCAFSGACSVDLRLVGIEARWLLFESGNSVLFNEVADVFHTKPDAAPHFDVWQFALPYLRADRGLAPSGRMGGLPDIEQSQQVRLGGHGSCTAP